MHKKVLHQQDNYLRFTPPLIFFCSHCLTKNKQQKIAFYCCYCYSLWYISYNISFRVSRAPQRVCVLLIVWSVQMFTCEESQTRERSVLKRKKKWWCAVRLFALSAISYCDISYCSYACTKTHTHVNIQASTRADCIRLHAHTHSHSHSVRYPSPSSIISLFKYKCKLIMFCLCVHAYEFRVVVCAL